MPRPLIALLVTGLLIVTACGDGGDIQRPKASAHPQLTAEEVLQRFEDEGVSEITRTVSISSGELFDGEEEREETLTIGSDSYSRTGDFESLFYKEEFYIRAPGGKAWIERPSEFDRIEEIFQRVGEREPPAWMGLAEDVDGLGDSRRLPDEIRDGKHLIGVRTSLDESIFNEFYDFFFSAVAEEAATSVPENLPSQYESTFEMWIRADNLAPAFIESELSGSDDRGHEVFRTRQTIEFLEGAELPGPLPD